MQIPNRAWSGSFNMHYMEVTWYMSVLRHRSGHGAKGHHFLVPTNKKTLILDTSSLAYISFKIAQLFCLTSPPTRATHGVIILMSLNH